MILHRGALWVSGLFALAALLLLSSTLPFASDVEARLATLTARPVESGRRVLQPLADLVLHAGEVRALSEENADLRLRVARLEGEAAALRERAMAAEQVADLVRAVGPDAGRYVAAPVLLRDPSPAREVLVIGRGRADGLTEGQPALGPGAILVGVVSHVEEHQARVRLLTDPGSAVAVLLERSRQPAALAGDRDALRLDYVPLATPGVEGDLVLTSALGGLLPPGLPVGRVTHVEAREPEVFQHVIVEPLTDYRRLEHVLVLVDFRPGAPREPAR